MKKFNNLLNSRVADLKSFPGSKAKQLSHTLPILEEYEYDASILHVGINDLLSINKSSSTLVSIGDDIVNAGLRCQNFNIGKIFISRWYSVQNLLQKT